MRYSIWMRCSSFCKARNVNSNARGRPCVLKNLPLADLQELRALSAEITGLPSWSEKRDKARAMVGRWPGNSSSRRHVEDRCFKRGRQNWQACKCKKRTDVSASLGNPSSSSSSRDVPSGASSSRAAVIVTKLRSG